MATKRELPAADDAPLPERGETTPNSLTSTGKKPRMEDSEDEEVNQVHHKAVTPSIDLESKDGGTVTEERCQSNWSSGPKNVHGVHQKVSQSPRLLYTELVECHNKIYQVKSSSTCKIILDAKKIDKKEDEVMNINRNAISQMPNNVNFSNERSCQVHRPFEMVSPIWKAVEALDVFKHIPQMPHFRKIAGKCEEEREGRAIGMMVTYSNIAESIQRLQMRTRATDFESKIACLISLEENGFIVSPIRSHLQALLALKTNDANSMLKQIELENKLTKKERENINSRAAVNGLETELMEVRKKLEELRKRVYEMEEKEKGILVSKTRVLVEAFEGEHLVARMREDIAGIEHEHAVNLEEFERVRSRPLMKYLL